MGELVKIGPTAAEAARTIQSGSARSNGRTNGDDDTQASRLERANRIPCGFCGLVPADCTCHSWKDADADRVKYGDHIAGFERVGDTEGLAGAREQLAMIASELSLSPDAVCRLTLQEIYARQRRIEWRAQRFRALTIAEEHRGASLDDFDAATAARARLLLDASKKIRGARVTGNFGTGKTRLLSAVARAYIDGDCGTVEFYVARHLFRTLWATFGASRETEDRLFRSLTGCGLLLIDDLGFEAGGDGTVGALHEIVNERHANYRLTVVSTNLTMEEIGKRYGGAIASRIGSWVPIVLVGKDRRGEG